jgi:hypothetical protein
LIPRIMTWYISVPDGTLGCLGMVDFVFRRAKVRNILHREHRKHGIFLH